jgi:hypothetical protein
VLDIVVCSLVARSAICNIALVFVRQISFGNADFREICRFLCRHQYVKRKLVVTLANYQHQNLNVFVLQHDLIKK